MLSAEHQLQQKKHPTNPPHIPGRKLHCKYLLSAQPSYLRGKISLLIGTQLTTNIQFLRKKRKVLYERRDSTQTREGAFKVFVVYRQKEMNLALIPERHS